MIEIAAEKLISVFTNDRIEARTGMNVTMAINTEVPMLSQIIVRQNPDYIVKAKLTTSS